jgi:hypothetical protein
MKLYKKVNHNNGYMWLRDDLVGYKKVQLKSKYYIVKLLIPSYTLIKRDITYFDCDIDLASRRRDSYARKLRAETAFVLEVKDMKGNKVPQVINTHIYKLTYEVGGWAMPHEFYTGALHCAGGIHFFTRRKDAVNY